MNTKILVSRSVAVAFLFSSLRLLPRLPRTFVRRSLSSMTRITRSIRVSRRRLARMAINPPPPNGSLMATIRAIPCSQASRRRLCRMAPVPAEGTKMIHIESIGNESGVYQPLPAELIHSKLMFSAWVNVKKGHVFIGLGSFVGGPGGWSTKHNQWEELHVCSNGNPNAPAQDAVLILQRGSTAAIRSPCRVRRG